MAGMPVFLVLVALAAAAAGGAWFATRRTGEDTGGLAVGEMDLLRRAELAVAAAPTPAAAARELGKHAQALLGVPAALVLIEGVGDTVRMEVGDAHGNSVYGPGSRTRLFDDDGVPVGSISVAPRSGKEFDERDERILDTLAQRVSATLHRLSLFEAVKTEQRTLADVLASSSDGIMAVGADGRVEQWNPAMERLTGTSAGSAIGQSCCSVFRPTDEQGVALYGHGCPCRAGEQIEVMAKLASRRPGDTEIVWVNCAFSPMSTGGSVVVARDVTARKQIEDEKADFLATVSHELRTPLTPIKGFLQTLLRRGSEFSDEDRQQVYEVMLREEQRLERLVEQLLQATSLDHADKLLMVSAVGWAAIVDAQVRNLRTAHPDRDITLLVRRELPQALADPQLAGQVLANLLSNAEKFSPAGTPIKVTVGYDQSRIVTRVADAGPGIPEADRERIFDRFTRLGDHLTRPQQGVGLGLYIARRSVEAMGGDVWVDEADTGGAAFCFSLPVAPASGRGRVGGRVSGRVGRGAISSR